MSDLPGSVLTWQRSPLFNRLNSVADQKRRNLSLLKGKLYNMCYEKRNALLCDLLVAQHRRELYFIDKKLCRQFKSCSWCSCYLLFVLPLKQRIDMTINYFSGLFWDLLFRECEVRKPCTAWCLSLQCAKGLHLC